MKNLLFITWDGPQTSYMEGLFMPIFSEIQRQNPKWKFHVIQFTWGDSERIAVTQKAAVQLGVEYQAFPISRKPIPNIGSFISLWGGASKIEKYIETHQIDVLMPRSTFPAFMVNQLKNFQGKIIFDADGLPIEERVDFAGLKKGSAMYSFLKNIETNMLRKADAVVTRSQKAIDIHIEQLGEAFRHSFSVVFNGRDAEKFSVNEEWREAARKEVGMQDEILFVYAGSLGPQYCLNEMLQIFQSYAEKREAKFLILTGNTAFAEQNIPTELKAHIILKSVPSEKVSFYLNGGDLAFGLRKPTFSMQGVAPIKLGEYLLCGLPVIASKGIGDTERILENFEECYLYDHSVGLLPQIEQIKNFVEKAIFADRNNIAQKAQDYFSLEAAAESYIKAIKN